MSDLACMVAQFHLRSHPSTTYVNLEQAQYFSWPTHAPVLPDKDFPSLVDHLSSHNNDVFSSWSLKSDGNRCQYFSWELRAIWMYLQLQTPFLQRHPIRVQSDSATAMAYVIHQGGTRGQSALNEESHIISLSNNLWGPQTRSGQLESKLALCLLPGSWEMDPSPKHLPQYVWNWVPQIWIPWLSDSTSSASTGSSLGRYMLFSPVCNLPSLLCIVWLR